MHSLGVEVWITYKWCSVFVHQLFTKQPPDVHHMCNNQMNQSSFSSFMARVNGFRQGVQNLI